MEDFFYAGGLRALMGELRGALDLSCLTVTGKSIGENVAGAEVYKRDVIHPRCRGGQFLPLSKRGRRRGDTWSRDAEQERGGNASEPCGRSREGCHAVASRVRGHPSGVGGERA